MKYLNLGCGNHFSNEKEWTNVDFVSTGKDVIAHNLLSGIPFDKESFDAVYHSHVLEHFLKVDGQKFIQECYRVLKFGGILRIAIPNLEQIISNYTQITEKLKANPNDAYLEACYDWIMLEMYDQTIRNHSGGDMVAFLSQDKIINEDFVLKRCGYEVSRIIEYYKTKKNLSESPKVFNNYQPPIKQRIINLFSFLKRKLIEKLLTDEFKALQIGKFRLGGEVHCWMYDSISLTRLLKQTGFTDIKECNVKESSIENWNDFELETINGKVRKPDSLFMEARKK